MSDASVDAPPPVLAMSGDVDIATENEWRRKGDELVAANPELRDVIIDMSGVDFLDSRGMAVLVHLHGVALQRAGRLVLRAVPSRIAKALNVAGLDQVFALEP